MDDSKTLGGRYILESKIRRGSIATVYQAQDTVDERVVALKILHSHFGTDPRFVIQFREYLKAISGFSHENLVSIFDYGLIDGNHYLATEWIDGPTLTTYIAEQGALSHSLAVHIARQICDGVGMIHQHSHIHRDLKPENILLTADGLVKVTDVGLSAIISESGLSKTDLMLDSINYISPEQARGEPIGPASDIYSIGIILFEMLTNRLPFDSDDSWSVVSMHANEASPSPREFDPRIPIKLSQIVEQALQKQPEKRFSNVQAMDTALEKLPSNNSNLWQSHSNQANSNRWVILPSLLTSTDLRDKINALGSSVERRIKQNRSFGPTLGLQFLVSFVVAFVILFFASGMVLDSTAHSNFRSQDIDRIEAYHMNDLRDSFSKPLIWLVPEDQTLAIMPDNEIEGSQQSVEGAESQTIQNSSFANNKNTAIIQSTAGGNNGNGKGKDEGNGGGKDKDKGDNGNGGDKGDNGNGGGNNGNGKGNGGGNKDNGKGGGKGK
jgi:serine/threonine-protein kinase